MSSDLSHRIASSKILKPQEKLILGILSEGKTTVEQLVDCVTSKPDSLTLQEAIQNLDELREKGLIEIAKFRKDSGGLSVDTLITVAMDWVLKL